MKTLEKKIRDGSAKVGIIGLGYVGLPLAMEFTKKGHPVAGFDVDKRRVSELMKGRSYILDVPSSELQEALKAGKFTASAKGDRLSSCDVIIICVPTPLRKTKEPDVSFILDAVREVAPRLKKGMLVVLESTTYPGTTREIALPILEAKGLKVGRDFHLAFSPERVDPANPRFGVHNTPKVVGGITPACTRVSALLYGRVAQRVVPVATAESAEMAKLLENTFRAVNIGLVNEMAQICHRLKLDVWEIIEAASTKPFGFMPFFPGPGLGGHCIPVDPVYLAWKMKAMNFEPRFIDLAGVINSSMPDFTVERVAELLNEDCRSLKGSRILALGMAYKPEVTDVRESPSFDVIKLLLERGASVQYHDPYVAQVDFEGRPMRSVPLTPKTLRAADAVVVLTAHKKVDYALVARHARRVFDARNAMKGLKGNIVRL
ncbi:MAG TPA: UDP-N-acetyl-D-glucosamine dehydrogenase [Elusimicrobia bacterium]|nr:UDP-N-acetyl-D-glucosamine dehydrogenase [Elusimicrobiota bacterium]